MNNNLQRKHMNVTKQPKTLVLKGGTIVDPLTKNSYSGDVLIKDGKIAGVGKVKTDKSATVIDCSGKIVTHGFCDIHVHFREPGREDKETLATGSRAAIAGGFTRVCVMPNTTPPLDSPETIRYTVEKAENLPVYVHPIGAVTKGQKGKELTEMAAMKREGAIAFSDDGVPISDATVMRLALDYGKMVGAPVINHSEDVGLRNDGLMNEGAFSTKLGLPGNPDIAESTMVNRDIEIAKIAGSNLHIPHTSTQKSVEHIRRMKKQNIHITAEVAPHHLYFTDADLVTYDTNLKVAPPVRSADDKKALIAGLKDGTIDCIATDHAPHTIEDKEKTFDLAPFGMIGLESCFGAVNKVLVKDSGWDVESLISAMTVNPRRIMGFETDLFSIGTKAEITVLDTTIEWRFTEEDIYSRSKNSPYVGRTLVGKPQVTLSKGMMAEIG